MRTNAPQQRVKRTARRAVIVAVLAAATLVALAGCGQRGPLYLPKNEKAVPDQPVPQQSRPVPSPDGNT